jgi:hypothetical protein
VVEWPEWLGWLEWLEWHEWHEWPRQPACSLLPLAICLFVCLFHGVPEVRGGRRLTKDGPYATRRQAEAFLFVRRKPTPPFAGCQGNLLFRGSRGLQTGRPVDHRPYSARHVGLLVGSFWNNKDSVLYKGRELRLATDRHAPMATNWFGE